MRRKEREKRLRIQKKRGGERKENGKEKNKWRLGREDEEQQQEEEEEEEEEEEKRRSKVEERIKRLA